MTSSAAHRRVRNARARRFGPLAFLLAALCNSPAPAQMVHLDPMLWTAPTDSLAGPSLEIRVDRFEEPKFGWAADRVLATLRLPVGPKAGFFVRLPHATFDFGDTPLFSRWPWLEPPLEEGEEGTGEFRSERRVTSFGQIEVGGDRRARWPGLGEFAYGGALGLPTGTDRLYPISSISFPVRLEVRKSLEAGRSLQLDLDGGGLIHIDSGDELLDEKAFPGGWHAGLGLRLGAAQGRHLRLEFDHQDREGRLARRATAALVLPRGERSSLRLRVDRELAGSLDRFAAWRFSIAWRLDHRSRSAPPAAETADPSGSAPPGEPDPGAPMEDRAPPSSRTPPD